MKSKKILAALMAGAVALCSSGCTIGGDKSWSAKSGDTKLPAGVYIYELFSAYNQAKTKAGYTTYMDMKTQTIDGKDAFTWTKDTAKNSINQIFVIDDMMKDLNLTLSDDDNTTINTETASAWNGSSSNAGYGSTLEKYNIAKSSFQIAYAEYYVKYQKVFEAIYGQGGSKEISAEDQKAYFEKNFASFEMIPVALYSKDSSGSYSVMSDDDKAKLKTELEGYASEVKGGKKSMSDVGTDYMNAHSDTVTASPNQDVTTDLETSGLPTDVVTGIQGMNGGDVQVLDIGSYYILVSKRDIKTKTDAALQDQQTKLSVLNGLKGDEFQQDIEQKAENYTNATFNTACINAYTPDLFYTTPSSSAAASSEDTSENPSSTSDAVSSTSSAA
ncbi:hypothetical protein ACVS9P_00710 [Caproicibacterium sp. NSD3]